MSISLILSALLQAALPSASDGRPCAFVSVEVVPMDSERVLHDQTVLVVDGRIAAVGSAEDVAVPAEATRIDGRGKFLIPGLCDAHVHVLDEGDLLVYLANGVTTVRNLKGSSWHLELRERIERGEILGPRFLTSGPFVNEPAYRTPEDVRRAVNEQKALGYDCLKIHGDLAFEAYEALLEAGAEASLPVVGHVPRNLPLERVLELGGQVEISHAEEFLYTYFDRLKGPVDSAAIESIARKTAEVGVTVTPNLVAYQSIQRQVEDLGRELARPEIAWVAPPVGRSWKPDLNRYKKNFTRADAAVLAQRLELLKRLTKALSDAKVCLLAGSDAMNPAVVPGFSLHEELALLVAAGLSPYQALRAATIDAGRFLGSGAGVVAVGAPADLVLLDANPLETIAAAGRIGGVMIRGAWLAKQELDTRMKALAASYAKEEVFMGRIELQDFDAALAQREVLRAKDPEAFVFRPEGLESLVLVYSAIGNVAAARGAAELAVEEFPGRWTAWVRLGEASLAAQDEDAAREAFEHALELHVGDARIERALTKLGALR